MQKSLLDWQNRHRAIPVAPDPEKTPVRTYTLHPAPPMGRVLLLTLILSALCGLAAWHFRLTW